MMFPIGLRHHLPAMFDLFIILSVPTVLAAKILRRGELRSGPHIADVNILLPPKMTHPVEYRLHGSDGCFKWSWDHHDILSVVPVYNENNSCSMSALLRSIAPYTGRKETSVFASDVRTGMIIRCKVFIDMFSRIHISRSSIKLDSDGLATLRVMTFDNEGVDEQASGYWFSTSGSVLVDSSSVVYRSSNVTLQTTVFVRKGNVLFVDVPKKTVTNALFPARGYNFSAQPSAHLYPQNPILYPGSLTNFSVKGVNEQASGHWFSTNGSVLLVDSSSGKAQAFTEDATKVVYRSSNYTLQTIAIVRKGNVIFVDAPKETITNAPTPCGCSPREYYFSVKLSDNKVGSPRMNVDVLFNCRVDPPFIGYAKSWRSRETGYTYCVFSPYTPVHLAHTLLSRSRRDMGVSTTIFVHASLVEDSSNIVTGYASAAFVGGFSVLGFNPQELHLTRLSNRSIISLVGNTDDALVEWKEKDHLLISRVHDTQDLSKGIRMVRFAHYEVKITNLTTNINKTLRNKITFSLPTNGQKFEVNVIYDPEGQLESKWSIAWVLAIYLGSLSLLGLITALVDFCNGIETRVPRQTTTPSTISLGDQSPRRIPPAFLEYLRINIDKTPYYRADAIPRRLANRQNSY